MYHYYVRYSETKGPGGCCSIELDHPIQSMEDIYAIQHKISRQHFNFQSRVNIDFYALLRKDEEDN